MNLVPRIFIAFLIGAAIVIGAFLYRQKVWSDAFKDSTPDRIIGVRAATIYVTIREFNPQTNELVVVAKNSSLNDYIAMRLKLSKDFYMQRSDAIIEKGIMVGTTPIVSATTDQLTPDTRGIAVFAPSREGNILVLRYILIGNPFPHP